METHLRSAARWMLAVSIGGASALWLGAGPAHAVGGSDVNPGAQVTKATEGCQKQVAKVAAKYAFKAADSINKCVDALLKCDEQSDDAKANDCRRKLVRPGKGVCAEGRLDEGVTLIGVGSAAEAAANASSKAKLIKEYNKLVAGIDKKCSAAGVDTGDGDTGLGFGGATLAADLADRINVDPGGIGCMANQLVLASTPKANEILDIAEGFHETCVEGNVGDPCTTDGDCGAGGVCGQMAQTLRDGSLRACAGQVFVATGEFLATGLTTSWVAGDDGDTQTGAELAYLDTGNGTVIDLNTGLLWEKKSDDGTLHDWHFRYPWRGSCSGDGTTECGTDADCTGVGGTCDAADGQTAFPNGLTIFEWVEQLNLAAFAGYTDWRVPNRRELESIVPLEFFFPSVDPVFNDGCGPACSITTCSCTQSGYHWSSSTYAGLPSFAWLVGFFAGDVTADDKTGFEYVRAVRGGS